MIFSAIDSKYELIALLFKIFNFTSIFIKTKVRDILTKLITNYTYIYEISPNN